MTTHWKNNRQCHNFEITGKSEPFVRFTAMFRTTLHLRLGCAWCIFDAYQVLQLFVVTVFMLHNTRRNLPQPSPRHTPHLQRKGEGGGRGDREE